PVLHALQLQIDALVLREHRIVGAELLEEAAVARIARVGNDDAILRALFCANTSETNNETHSSIPFADFSKVHFFFKSFGRFPRPRSPGQPPNPGRPGLSPGSPGNFS